MVSTSLRSSIELGMLIVSQLPSDFKNLFVSFTGEEGTKPTDSPPNVAGLDLI